MCAIRKFEIVNFRFVHGDDQVRPHQILLPDLKREAHIPVQYDSSGQQALHDISGKGSDVVDPKFDCNPP